jgi:transposase
MARGDLTDAEWERIAPLLPRSQGRRGGQWRDHRQVINGILWILRTGAQWEDLPPRYGPRSTAHDRLRSWAERGVNRLKQFRRIATRYEKRAANYLGFVHLACIMVWLRA